MTVEQQETTIEERIASLQEKLDILGGQMNWLCENLESLFAFVTQMGQSGGGIRGMLKMLNNNSVPEPTLRQGDGSGA